MSSNSATVPSSDEFKLASSRLSDELYETQLSIPELNCGGCVNKIEKQLASLAAVRHVRANLTKKRISVQWYSSGSADDILESIRNLGFNAALLDSPTPNQQTELKPALRALAISGFAASNVMLMSVAVWSGADDSTRQLFHWISAAIALPAIAYSGSVFFKSAWKAVRSGRTNMDVPVSIGILLSIFLGVYDTINHQERVYFEAATMLVFFLLIGRTLDKMMRVRAATSADGLRALEPSGAYVLNDQGETEFKATRELQLGDRVLVKAGGRMPVDGVIVSGESYLDTAIVDGESRSKLAKLGQSVFGGTLNVSNDLTVKVTATAENSFIAQMHHLVEFAHTSKGLYTRIADRAAQWYAPVVHSAAVIAFVFWIYLSGDVHKSLTIAISVLIITCPCALALAVPMVQVMAASRLLNRGIIMKDGVSLEKLAEVGTVVFDKTGTLTNDEPSLVTPMLQSDKNLKLALLLAQGSHHPYAQALKQRALQSGISYPALDTNVVDIPGCGLEAFINGESIRLGRREWAIYPDATLIPQQAKGTSETVLSRGGRLLAEFSFSDEPRLGAVTAIKRLQHHSLKIAMISGDQLEPVAVMAKTLAIDDAHAKAMPADKVSFIQKLSVDNPVLMVGDGMNDSGAMAASHVSMAPGTAASIGRNLADFVFIQEDLNAVPDAIDVAYKAKKLIRQNIAFAITYNLVVLPVAFAGLVTPLFAAAAMSLSSILVVANALRLSGFNRAGLRHSAIPKILHLHQSAEIL